MVMVKLSLVKKAIFQRKALQIARDISWFKELCRYCLQMNFNTFTIKKGIVVPLALVGFPNFCGQIATALIS